MLHCLIFFFIFIWLRWALGNAGSLSLHVGPFAAAQAQVVAHRLSNCGGQAQLLHIMWDLSSPTRDQTHVPCIARWILNHQRSPCTVLLTPFFSAFSCVMFFCSWNFIMFYSISFNNPFSPGNTVVVQSLNGVWLLQLHGLQHARLPCPSLY